MRDSAPGFKVKEERKKKTTRPVIAVRRFQGLYGCKVEIDLITKVFDSSVKVRVCGMMGDER